MLKKLSVLVLLLTTSFADTTLLKTQLFWDTGAAYDYSTRLVNHPEIHELPVLDGLPEYARVRTLVSELRLKRSEAVIYGNSVRLKSLEMNKLLPKLINVVLSWFERGYKKDINHLVDTDYEIRELHKKIMQTNIRELFTSTVNSHNLEAFSGRLLIDGVSFNTLRIKSQKLTPVADFSPFLMFDPTEPSCVVNLFDGAKRVPLYTQNQYFSSVTALCKFDGFYTKEDLREFGRLWSTDFQLVLTRIEFLDDFAKFLSEAKVEVGRKQSELNQKLEESTYFIKEVEKLQTLLKNSSVKLALLEISTESRLLANSFEFDFLGWDHSEKIEEYSNSIGASQSLGKTYQIIFELMSYLNNIDSQTSLAINSINSKIETMKNLCISYGSSCSFDGDISTRLILTSNTFLDLRLKYLNSVGQNEASDELLLGIIVSEITNAKTLVSKIENYIKPKNTVVYTDTIRGFEIESDLLKSSTDLNSLKIRIRNFREKVISKFFEENVEAARKIKAELLSLSEILDFEIQNRPLSVQNDPVENIIYYLSNADFLAKTKEAYKELLTDFSSNIPSSFECIPKVPLLGENFRVKCNIFVNNTYNVLFETASSVLDLPYKPLFMSSKNFIGDTSKLKSVSFSGGQVRLNLIDIKGAAFFETTYISEIYSLNQVCDYTYSGLDANYTCTIISVCEDKGTVKITHPFSGRQMTSTHNYTYDGKYVYFETTCNQINEVVFSGPSVELSEDNGLVIESLINSTQTNTIFLEVQHPRGYNASVSFSLNSYEKKIFALDAILPEIFNDTTNNETEKLTQPFNLLTSPPAFEFGCVEKNILETVTKNYRFDKPTCFVVDELKTANTLFLSDQLEAATKEYHNFIPSPKLEVYLAKSKTYFERSTYLIEQLESLNGVSSTLLKKYIKKAKLSHKSEDYLVASIYAQYALMKSTTNLKFDFRVVLALLVLAYGLYASKQKEKEELI